jgi:hypothetical protein
MSPSLINIPCFVKKKIPCKPHNPFK